jgi:transposase-like protein
MSVTGPRMNVNPFTADPEERAFLVAALLSAGETLDEIALRFNVSRERIRQIAAVHGDRHSYGRHSPADPIRICRAAETATTLQEVAQATGFSRHTARHVLQALGKWDEFKARRPAYTHESLIALLQAMAATLGRTPKVKDLRPGEPSNMTFVSYFGSWRQALVAAGLPLHHQIPDKTTPEQRAEAVRQYAAGRTQVSIAAELGVDSTAVSNWVGRARKGCRLRAPRGHRKAAPQGRYARQGEG